MLTKNVGQCLIDEGFYSAFVEEELSAPFKELSIPNCNDSRYKQDNRLEALIKGLDHYYKDIIQDHFGEVNRVRYSSWDDVDEGSKYWHNDLDEANLSVLLYLDHHPKNFIEIRSPLGDTKIVPQKNQFVMVNQSKGHLHKASVNCLPRRIIGIDYNLEMLRWI